MPPARGKTTLAPPPPSNNPLVPITAAQLATVSPRDSVRLALRTVNVAASDVDEDALNMLVDHASWWKESVISSAYFLASGAGRRNIFPSDIQIASKLLCKGGYERDGMLRDEMRDVARKVNAKKIDTIPNDHGEVEGENGGVLLPRRNLTAASYGIVLDGDVVGGGGGGGGGGGKSGKSGKSGKNKGGETSEVAEAGATKKKESAKGVNVAVKGSSKRKISTAEWGSDGEDGEEDSNKRKKRKK